VKTEARKARVAETKRRQETRRKAIEEGREKKK